MVYTILHVASCRNLSQVVAVVANSRTIERGRSSRYLRSFGLKAIQYEIYRVVIWMAYAYVCNTLNLWGVATALALSSSLLTYGVDVGDWPFSTFSVFLVHVKVSANCTRAASGVRVGRNSLSGGHSCQTKSSGMSLSKSQGGSFKRWLFQAVYYELNRFWPADFLAWHGRPQFSYDW
jgi:hypothetical protein